MITIQLKENEAQLLMSILDEAQDERSSMGCNDAYKSEEQMFSKSELKEMIPVAYEDEFSDEDIKDIISDDKPHLSNWGYVCYLKNKIKKQTGI